MVNGIEKTCPSCRQFYHVPYTSCKVKENLPLFLPCGHTMCETCIVQIMRCMGPIECKVCHREAEVKTTDRDELNQNKLTFYQKFPVNVTMVGELVMHQMKTPDTTEKKTEEDCYIDLKALLKNDLAQGKCVECNAATSRMCKQCVAILCDTCFNKSHKSYTIFKNHLLQNIELCALPTTCKAHTGNPLEYYCNDCKKSVCIDCMILGGAKSCKNHEVVSLQAINQTFLEDVTNIAPQVDETFRRLTKTAVDIGYLLHNYDNDNGTGYFKELSKTVANVEQHFSKLFSVVQKNKDEIMNIITYLKFSNKNSLQKAKSEVEKSIKKAKNVLTMITAVTDTNNIKQMNLPALLEEAKAVTNTAWYLNKTESNHESLKVTVNEDLCALMSDYLHLEGNVNSMYKLNSTSELGDDVEVPPAPNAPVYPPEMPKDVRECYVSATKPKEEKVNKKNAPVLFKEVPTYRRKSASVSTQNSNCSEKSSNSQEQVPVQNFQPQVAVKRVAPIQHPPELREGSQELIYITHIVDPNNFYVQHASSQELVKDVIEKYRDACAFPTPHPEEISPGFECLAFNNGDNMWQRCRVLSVLGEGYDKKSQVFCYDFGCIESVGVNWLRVLPPSVSLIFPLAIYCSLHNCVSKTGQWTINDAQLMRKIIEGKQAKMHILRILNTSNVDFKLECDIYTYEHGISLAHALVFHGRANLRNLRLKRLKNMGMKEKFQVYIGNYYYKADKTESVYMTHVVSAEEFYVRKESHQELYEELTQDLDKEYSLDDKTGAVFLPEIGTVCAVNLENCSGAPDVTWARGVVAEHAGRACVLMQLPDSGHVVQVHWTKLRYITCEKFIRLSALATKCHLAGVEPPRNKWGPASIGYLQQYLGRLLKLQVEDNREKYRSQGSLGITLNDRTDNVHICINDEMVKYNFAVWIGTNKSFKKTHKPLKEIVKLYLGLVYEPKQAPPKLKETVLKKNVAEKINNKDSQTKNKGPQRKENKIIGVCDKTQTKSEDKTDDVSPLSLIKPTPIVPLETVKFDDDFNANLASSFPEAEDNNRLPNEATELSNVKHIADWEPAEPLDWEFTGIPRHIDNDGVIFLQYEDQQDKLDLIHTALDVHFKNTDPKAIFDKWSVGEPCAVLYDSDNRYYRARVIEVDEVNSTCLVHYIDYGYEENCTFANMRKSVPLLQVPTQAHKCILNRIRPLGKQWDAEILNYIHETVVDKQCYVKLPDELGTGAVSIEIEFDDISFNDHLVEVKLAEYIEGSKALVRQPWKACAPTVKEHNESDPGSDYVVVDDADTSSQGSSGIINRGTIKA